MILGVIDGYYRQGTTVIQRLVDKHVTTIHEPASPSVHVEIKSRNFVGCQLHGWDVYKGYFEIPAGCLSDLVELPAYGFAEKWEQVKCYLDVLDDSPTEVVVKSCQWGLFLDKISRKFPVIHVCRTVLPTVQSHLEVIPRPLWYQWLLQKDANEFYVSECHRVISRYFKKGEKRTVIEKLKFNIQAMNELRLPGVRYVWYENPREVRAALQDMGIAVLDTYRPINFYEPFLAYM